MGLKVIRKEEGLIVAGTPVGSQEFEKNWCRQKSLKIIDQLETVRALTEKENSIEDAEVQTAFTVARWSIAAQFNHILRTCSFVNTEQASQELDNSMFETMMELGGCRELVMDAQRREVAEKRFFLPIRLGGNGFGSASRSRKAAFAGSVAQSMCRIFEIAPELAEEGVLRKWECIRLATQAVQEVSARTNIKKEDIDISDIGEQPKWKLQQKMMRAIHEAVADELVRRLPVGIPSAGGEIVGALNVHERVVKMQGLCNRDKTASAWLSANPAFYANRMNNAAFIPSFRRRNLLPIVPPGQRCRCGMEVDMFGQHAFVCENKFIKARVTNASHANLAKSLRETMRPKMKNIGMTEIRTEPQMENYYPRIEQPNRRRDDDDTMYRADVGFNSDGNGGEQALLVDVALKSIMVKALKTYKPGELADARALEKVHNYEKRFNIKDSTKAKLFFFTVESLGALGKEAVKLCKFLAKFAGEEHYSVELQRIYQRISVNMQTNIQRQTMIYMEMIRRSFFDGE